MCDVWTLARVRVLHTTNVTVWCHKHRRVALALRTEEGLIEVTVQSLCVQMLLEWVPFA